MFSLSVRRGGVRGGPEWKQSPVLRVTLVGWGRQKNEKQQRRRRNPGASFLHRHLTGSLWRLQPWKMKISSVVFALLTRALFAGRKKLILLQTKAVVLEKMCFPLFFRET